ncbi:MAG: hypothetical protein ACI4WS_14140 [Oscillospiraceae bacterium]
MWNIIRAQNYQTRSDIVTVAALIFISALTVISPVFNAIPFSELTGSEYALNFEKAFLLYILLIVTTRVCGWDQSDKTINYELLAGHKKSEIYFGRIITSFIWVGAASVVLLFVPMAACAMINGWGDRADFSEIMLRFLMLLLPLFRIACECILLTFLVRNGGLGTVLGFVLLDISAMISSFMMMEEEVDCPWILGTLNFMVLSSPSDYSYGYVNGEDVVIYDASIDPSLVVGTAAASVLVGAACLIIGFVYFRKSDMK